MLLNLIGEQEEVVALTHNFFKLLKVSATITTLKAKLISHPFYPSLLSINDVLNELNVQTAAVYVEEAQLKDIPVPFIAHQKIKGVPGFIIVSQIEKAGVFVINEKGRKSIVPIGNFKKHWDGNCLLAKPGDNAGEPQYRMSLIRNMLLRSRYILLAALFVMLQGYILTKTVELPHHNFFFVFTACIILGIAVTGVLFLIEIGTASKSIRSFCGVGTENGCDGVLGSKYAKLFGNISWSEIGASYFISMLVLADSYFLLFKELDTVLLFIAIVSVLTTPFIVASLSLQGLFIRQWCKLCVAVQVVLCLSAVVSFYFLFVVGKKEYTAIENLTPAFLTSFLAIVCLLNIAKDTLSTLVSSQKELTLSRRLRYNKEIFNSLLQNQKRVNIDPGLGIVLGSRTDGVPKILMVCNPYCKPCAKAHALIDQLRKKTPGLQLQIIYNATTDTADPRFIPVRHFISLNEEATPQIIDAALNAWFEEFQQDYDRFSHKYPVVSIEYARANLTVEEMYTWCNKNQVTSTPTLFINGYQLPSVYTLEDLSYLI